MYQNQAIQQPYIGDQRGVLTVALNAVRRAALAVVRWHQRRRAIRELMALDDRTLRDINVRRDDIYWVTDRILLGEDPFHFSPASPPPGATLPEAWTVSGREKSGRQAAKASRITTPRTKGAPKPRHCMNAPIRFMR